MTGATAERMIEISARTRGRRRAVRDSLIGLGPQELVQTIVNPSPEVATFRIHMLLVARKAAGPVPRFGEATLNRMLYRLRLEGCLWADSRVRLNQLTITQRRQLARALLSVAPQTWVRGER